MTLLESRPEAQIERVALPRGLRLRLWLDAELSKRWCVVGWIVATGVFVICAAWAGGPGRIDGPESLFSTWAIAHGQFNCAFPSVTMSHEPLIAPVYPLFSGAVTAIAGIGHAVPFPSHAAMGANCSGADHAIHAWALRARAATPTLVIGYASWLALLAGIIAWLRSVGRGRTGWEPATLVVVALLPLVGSTVYSVFHPQDLIAMGLGLAAMACARQQRWAGAGALIALAVLTQQFALLMAAPLFVLAPPARRARYVGAGAATAIIFVAPLFVLSGGTVLRAITLGSGDNGSVGGTLMWELSHSSAFVLLVSRVLPVALALAVSWWAVRRLGSAASSPAVMMSLVAVSLSLRLLFEQNIFEYYFMALAVALILVDVTRGHIRSSVVVWLFALLQLYQFRSWMFGVANAVHLEIVIPEIVVLAVMAYVATHRAKTRQWQRWNVLLWACVIAWFVTTWPTSDNPLYIWPQYWFIQGLFSVTGLLLAGAPLLEAVRRRADAQCEEPLSPLSAASD